MNTQRKVLQQKFNEYLEVEGITQGNKAVPVDVILDSFSKFAPTVPVTKSQLGRILSKKFLKRQLHYHTGSNLIQCYYLNKQV